MFKLVVVGLVMAVISATHPISEEMVRSIRAKTSLWQPHETETNPFANLTKEQLFARCGTYIVPPNKQYPGSKLVSVPENFDSREQWGKEIHAIRDQQQCGSCWAFGATEAFSDRYAIASGDKIDVVLSPEELVSCDTNDYGCNGGYMDMAWEFLADTGAVTDACFPYTAGGGNAPDCATKCVDGSEMKRFKCVQNSVRQSASVDQIKSEIFAHGPVEGAFTVYTDFFNYQSGVYSPTTSDVAGGHAIKILGWGVENGTNYWLCANSWGPSWGMSGFFKIKQGECGIEDQVFSCDPQL
ncbi:cathepsin b [Stylonychia lemnae]|uniref:Cathepsin b n=1 Tax=Stylonychia lemnae TaxID=5949 RepID=A0A077ZRI2_STYLE|nr:cathepsin b [Stylonychia lemnae]|eukprot:CDW72502.1 cathepsin b [Stylonychia lemnae]